MVSKVRDFLDLLGLPAAETLTSSSGCYRLRLPSDTAVDVELAERPPTRPSGRWARAGWPRRWRRRSGPGRSPGGRCCPATTAPGSRTGAPPSTRCWSGAWSCSSTSTWPPARPARPSARPATWSPWSRSGTPAYRRLLAARAAAGDRGGALLAYDRYRRVLAEELGVGPVPELEAAYLELLHAEPAAEAPAPATGAGAAAAGAGPRRCVRGPGPGAAPAPAPPGPGRPGRRRRTVLVAGEAGIGKTRLVSELAALAEAEGAVVLAGRCDQHLGVPYLPLREALGRHLAAYPSERLRALLGPRAAQLVQFWPELAWRLPALPAPPAAGPQADHYLLFEAFTGLLEAISVGGPLLLLVDDLHGADEASLLLLRSLAHARRPARLLTVLTYRDDERRPRTSLTAALGDLLRAPEAELLTLDGLDTGEVAAMAAATTARPLGPGARPWPTSSASAPAATPSSPASCCGTWSRPAPSAAGTSPPRPPARPSTTCPRACAGWWASAWPAWAGRSSTSPGWRP